MLMNLDLSDYSDDFTWEQKLNQAGQLDDITLKTTFEINRRTPGIFLGVFVPLVLIWRVPR